MLVCINIAISLHITLYETRIARHMKTTRIHYYKTHLHKPHNEQLKTVQKKFGFPYRTTNFFPFIYEKTLHSVMANISA